MLPPYTPRKAQHKKSFPCHDACIYVFGWNSTINRPNPMFPPTIPKSKDDVALEDHLATDIIPLTTHQIKMIRSKLLLSSFSKRSTKHKDKKQQQKKSKKLAS